MEGKNVKFMTAEYAIAAKMSNRGQHKVTIMFWYVSVDNMQFHSMPPKLMAQPMDFPSLCFSMSECKWRVLSCTLEWCVRNIRPPLDVRVIFKQPTSFVKDQR